MSTEKNISESTIARIAGNLLSGYAQVSLAIIDPADRDDTLHVEKAVRLARRIAAEVERTAKPPRSREGETER